MGTFSTILFWTGILFLVDGSVGLLMKDKWQKRFGGFDIQRLALIEITAALAVLTVYYFLLLNPD